MKAHHDRKVRFSSTLMVSILLLASLAVLVAPVGVVDQASANPWTGENTWVAASSGAASNAANWQNGSLVAGQRAWFVSGSVACSWDVSFIVYALIIKGYTGTISMTANNDMNLGRGGLTQTSGTLAGNSARWLNCDGNLNNTGGAINQWTLNLKMTRDGTQIAKYILNVARVDIQANVTALQGIYVFTKFTLAAGKTFTTSSYASPTYIYDGAVLSSELAGTFNGNGRVIMLVYSQGNLPNLASARWVCELQLTAAASVPGNRVMTATSSINAALVTISSSHASNTLAVNLSSYSHQFNGIAIGARGILLGSSSVITNAGAWDSSNAAATWTPGTSTVNQIGDNKTITLKAGQGFHKLNIVASSITPKWQTNIPFGVIYANITGLNASRTYSYLANNVQQAPFTTTSTSLAWSSTATGARYFELREMPKITPLPIDAAPFLRHQVDEGILYSVNYSADQTVTWTISGAPFLVNENGWVHGAPGSADQGTYLVQLTAANANGEQTISFVLVVEDTIDARYDIGLELVLALGVLAVASAALISMVGRTFTKKR